MSDEINPQSTPTEEVDKGIEGDAAPRKGPTDEQRRRWRQCLTESGTEQGMFG